MVRVLGRNLARAHRRAWIVAGEADYIPAANKVRIVCRAVHIVASETGDASAIHDALYEIVALHAILMRGSVGEVRE